jgi:hypothetical protein
MSQKIQIRRGVEAQRALVTPDAGEMLFTTDYKQLFVGDGPTARYSGNCWTVMPEFDIDILKFKPKDIKWKEFYLRIKNFVSNYKNQDYIYMCAKEGKLIELKIYFKRSSPPAASTANFICPQQVDDAIASGITTLIGCGTGPATGKHIK